VKDYVNYSNYKDYLNTLKCVFTLVYEITNDGRFCCVNLSNIIIQRENRNSESSRIPLAFHFVPLMEDIGWKFIEDIIWVKPEGAAKNRNGGSYLSKSKNDEGNETKLWFKENKIPLHKDIVMTKSFRVSSIEAFLQFSDNFPELTRNYKINWERLLRFVLKECKDNTRDEIESAVKEMCIYHNVNFQKIINNVPNKFTGVSFDEIVIRLLNKIKNVIQNKTITINDTKNFGVNNVFEASLLLNFFLNTKRNHKDF
jgi:hypothetical protein